MQTNPRFLSCDWGTTNFRLRLVEGETLHVAAENASEKGIASTFALWKQKNFAEAFRFEFYLEIISEAIQQMEQEHSFSLSGVPLIVSGMASAGIGMWELPYKLLPFQMDGSDLVTKLLPASDQFPHQMILISGARSTDDVMRGEEVQLIGSVSPAENGEKIFIFPGTHSKHVTVCKGIANTIQTHLTGELFHLLCTHSLLSVSVEQNSDIQEADHKVCFKKGVQDAIHMNPLHSFFLVRTNQLFQKMNPKENYHYLSGLLIGLELKELLPKKNTKLILVTNQTLKPFYTTALIELGLDADLELRNADETILLGHYQMYKQYLFLHSQ